MGGGGVKKKKYWKKKKDIRGKGKVQGIFYRGYKKI